MNLINNTIDTDRLILRAFRDSDIAAIHEYASDPIVCQFIDWGPNPLALSKDFLKRTIEENCLLPRRTYDWAVVLSSQNKLIGGVGLRLDDQIPAQASVGYVLNRQYWGHGYITEAVCAVLHFGFRNLKLVRILATCDARNLGSKRVLEKCGMKYKGQLSQDKFVRNQWRDTLEYCLLVNEWDLATNPKNVD